MNIVLAESTEIKEINRLIESAKRYWGYSDKLVNSKPEGRVLPVMGNATRLRSTNASPRFITLGILSLPSVFVLRDKNRQKTVYMQSIYI
ncbi:hypothetical protein C9J12_05195 [Photobacterium frigidiphilum]|uniref:Uncharacterized protein n=1 Tax=Photobacterium frigidiphilum TaxID=264736 RepID=A0A2T3JM86_9GAMM|nr:hypothetical protein [Photobacterium frigidiphilum]PSU50137.1 hypothetical protein C9J12_05195 [Photobacterium frigidiphilum]